MKPGLGWMHIKDYRCPAGSIVKGRPVDEDMLKNFVPANVGDCAHETLLRDFSHILPSVERKLRRRGIPGVFLDLEPHLKGGGQFGGFSGPDGMGVALPRCVACWTTSASTTISATLPTSRPPAASEPCLLIPCLIVEHVRYF